MRSLQPGRLAGPSICAATSLKRCALPRTKPRKIAGSVRLSLSYSAATDTGKSPILRAAACNDGRSPSVTNVIIDISVNDDITTGLPEPNRQR